MLDNQKLQNATIGQKIIELRRVLNLSQEAFGVAVGASQSAVSLIEGGKRSPNYRLLQNIYAFSVSQGSPLKLL